MPTTREQEIIEAYEAWDPEGTETITDLVEHLGISRSRLYAVLRSNDVELKSHRASAPHVDPLLSEMAEAALGYLLNQLQECRSELKIYRDRYGPV